MEDCCFICAEPLEWVAYGPCCHKEACSKCVMRMRFILKDTRCITCQQESTVVYVTRAMGDFTTSLPPEEFPKLNSKDCRPRGLHCLKSCNAFFDDENHFQHIRKLCSFTHSSLGRENGKQQTFQNLKDLKKHMATTFQLHFCDVCLASRKVFVAEQQLYTKAQLDRHNKQGDDEGPLAESGFSGHPLCKFCRIYFYGDNEIFQHMQTAHEHCFLCRRARPDKYVYYKDYKELEGHFRSDHYACEHPACIANRFVVFSTDAELKQHMALEHKDGMSKGQRREALALETAFQYERGGYGGGGAAASRPAAIVIGGGAGLNQRSSGGRSGNPAQDAISAHERQMVAAMEASIQTAQAEAAGLNLEDFPETLGGSSSLAGASSNRWAATTSSYGGGSITQEDFPALPTMSKAARRRANQRANSANRTTRPEPAASSVPAPANQMHRPVSEPDLFNRQGRQQSHQSPGPQRPHTQPPQPGPTAGEDWPRISASAASPAPPPSAARWASAAAGATKGPSPSCVPSGAGAAPPPAVHDDSAFPSLPAATGRRPTQPVSHFGQGARRPPSATAPPLAAAPAAAPSSIVSESLREANRLLIDKIRQRVDEASFAAFKQESGKFMRNQISAKEYFKKILDLGLLSLTPELAALCPEQQRRSELLDAFRSHSSASPSSSAGWVPPEVVEAASQQAEQFGSWDCGSCGVLNGPNARECEGCKAERDAVVLVRRDANADGDYELSASPKKGKKGKKSKSDRMQTGTNDGSPPADVTVPSSGRSRNPQNAWGGGGGSQLVQSISAVNDAWAGRR